MVKKTDIILAQQKKSDWSKDIKSIKVMVKFQIGFLNYKQKGLKFNNLINQGKLKVIWMKII